jgi:hypothetical protein
MSIPNILCQAIQRPTFERFRRCSFIQWARGLLAHSAESSFGSFSSSLGVEAFLLGSATYVDGVPDPAGDEKSEFYSESGVMLWIGC